MSARPAPPQTEEPEDTSPLIDVIDARAHCPNRVLGRLILDDEKLLHVQLMEPAPGIQVGSRLVLRCPQRRMSGVVVDRTHQRVVIEVLRVYRTEQRSWPRVSGNVRCLCRFNRSWTWPDRVVDVSVGGVAFITKASAQLDDTVTIMLSLPQGSGPWRLRARVVRVVPEEGAYRVAVAFVDLPDAARARLIRFSSELLTASMEPAAD